MCFFWHFILHYIAQCFLFFLHIFLHWYQLKIFSFYGQCIVHSYVSIDFFGIPLVSKLKSLVLVSREAPIMVGAEGPKYLNLILLHCWKRHLPHFKFEQTLPISRSCILWISWYKGCATLLTKIHYVVKRATKLFMWGHYSVQYNLFYSLFIIDKET